MKPINSMQSRALRMLILAFLLSLFLLSGCGSQPETAFTPTPTVGATDTPSSESSSADQAILDATGLEPVATLAGMAPTRTPEPTATPDALAQEINQVVQDTGLAGKTFFWLDIADWINLGISLLIVVVSYLLGTWIIHWLLPRLVQRIPTKLDDTFLKVSGPQLRWLVVLVILRFAVKRLSFGYPAVKTFIMDLCFFLIVFIIAELLWRLINLVAQQADARARKIGHQKEAESLITLMVWGLRLLVLTLVLMVILIHFGINVTGFAIILGVIAFVLSLAGRDILADIISGAMILIDQPYRIGDRLDLPSLDSWGDVIDIGMRSTKIQVIDNRTMVIPNSLIAKNKVINYNYPDSSYNNTIDVYVAYENDPDQVAKILEEATHSVAGVQTDRDITIWLHDLTASHICYWVSWWTANYSQRYTVQDQVSRAIIRALQEAGIVLPYQKRVNVQVKPDGPTTGSPPDPQS